MSNTRHSQALKRRASIFAALGDQTRLTVLARLSAGEAQSIARLTAGSRLSRQAMTKHLGVLTRAGIVHSMRIGRENLFRLRAAGDHRRPKLSRAGLRRVGRRS